jgi:DNA-binding LacI/PurR family transcriptional regulator
MPEFLSLPEQIAVRIREDLLSHRKAEDRLPTISDLAKHFGVSKHSIAGAIELLTRSGFVTKRQRRGIRVTAHPPHWRVGILSELNLFDHRIGHYHRAVAGEAKRQLEAAGIETRLYIGNAMPGPGKSDTPTCPQFWTDVAAGRLSGAVLLNVPGSNAWAARCRDCPIPTVGDWSGYEVRVNTAGIITTAVRRLAEQGCRRIGLLSWIVFPDLFRNAVRDHGLFTHDDWIRNNIDPSLAGAGWEEFREIWASKERPDGLIVLDDMLFADLQIALSDLGIRVPRDLKLAVQTNRGISSPARFPATVLEIDPAEEAAHYVEFLAKRLRGEAIEKITRRLSFREIPVRSSSVAATLPARESLTSAL